MSALFAGAQTAAQQDRIADGIVAESETNLTVHAPHAEQWGRQTALQLEGMRAAWYNTANGAYYRYLQRAVDDFLKAREASDGGSRSVDAAMGGPALLLYRVTLHKEYYEAASNLSAAAAAECGLTETEATAADGKLERTEGACVDAPFLAEYASVFQDPGAFIAIARALERWDEENTPAKTAHLSLSPAKRRGLAWEAKSVVDALPYFPADKPEHAQLVEILRRIAAELNQQPAATAAKAAANRPGRQMDDAPSTADCLLIYAVLRGVRMGYLPASDAEGAKREWRAVARQADRPSISQLEPQAGALLLAASEAELAPTATTARGKTVVLDAWYNSQKQKNAAGQIEYFHYKWFDMSNSGYSLLGHMFRGFGMKTETLYSAPTRENLRRANYYLIVSPDIPVKNPEPHYVTEKDAADVAAWVKQGGILILMENDPPNADIPHMNLLADKFGIHFDDVLHHHILGENVEDGTIPVRPGGPVFRHAHTLYMKDTCAISLSGSAVAVLRDRGDVVMATARYGRGRVFAAVDPWLYNEYTDGRRNPKIYGGFDNFGGGMELVRWLAEQRPEAGGEAEMGQKVQP